MKGSFSVDGLKEMDAALGEMSKATARNVLKRVLMKAGQPTADLASQLAPVDRGQLSRSVTVSPRIKNKAGSAEFSAVLRAGGSRAEAGQALRAARRAAKGSFVEVYIGPTALPHAHLMEFGTSDLTAQPFMRPAWEQTKAGIMAIIKAELAIEIDKAAKRAARKAARLVARG